MSASFSLCGLTAIRKYRSPRPEKFQQFRIAISFTEPGIAIAGVPARKVGMRKELQ